MQLINDLSVKLERYEKEINAAINRVVKSGWLVLGPEVERFEVAFAEYNSCEYCVSVANGTDALELALRAMNVASDNLVATVANAGAYTLTALNAIGASPYFIEVDEQSQCATLESVKAALSRGVNAVVITHLFGRVVPQVAEIAELCSAKGIPLLEDCAQAHGASLGGKLAGSFGDIASFSFYPTKNLGALGDGGAVTTNHEGYARAVKELRQYGWKNKYQVGSLGGRNSRLDAIQAALLNDFLPFLNEWNDERIRIAQRYDSEISNPLLSKPPLPEEIRKELPEEFDGSRPYVAHLYVVQSKRRDDLRQHLKNNAILSEVHYPIADHKQETMLSEDFDVCLPVTESLAENILTLPCYSGMSYQQVSNVIESVNSWTI